MECCYPPRPMNNKLKGWVYQALHPIQTIKINQAKKAVESYFASKPALPSNTVEAYDDLFRSNLHGHWDTCEFSVCPGDTYVGFNPDGKGVCVAGSSGMLGGGYEFKWRQSGGFTFEVMREGDDHWSSIDYGFVKTDKAICIHFHPAETAEEWVYDFAWDTIPLSCLQ